MHEDDDDGKGMLKKALISDCNILLFKALYQVKKHSKQVEQTNYTFKQKEEPFCHL